MSTNRTKLFSSLEKFNIIKLTDMNLQVIQNRKILLIMGFDILDTDLSNSIGDPVDYNKANKAGGAGGGQPTGQGQGVSSSTSSGPSYSNMNKSNTPTTTTNNYNNNNNNNYNSNNNNNSNSYRGPVQKTSNQYFTPISQLSVYSNKFTIKARVTNKGDIKRWSNPKGEGHLFSMEVIDENGDEIRGTFFKEVADKFYDMIQPGRVYTISGGRLKMANKQYTTVKCDYEITFDQSTVIELVNDDGGIKNCSFDFVTIGDLQNISPNALVDVIGIVKECYPVSTITTKRDNKELKKRDLLIADHSNHEVRLTLWGAKADGPDIDQYDHNPVVAFKGVKVSDYGGRTLGCVQNSQIFPSPEVEETMHLQNWWQTEGAAGTMTSYNNGSGSGSGSSRGIESRNYLGQIIQDGLGHAEKGDYINVKARFCFFASERNPWYPACTNGECKKKVTEHYSGGWHCDRCQTEIAQPEYRYILSAKIMDHTGNTFVSLFNDQATQVLGMSANELNALKEQSGEEGDGSASTGYDRVFENAMMKEHLITLKCKFEMVNDQPKLKVTVRDITPVDYEKECVELTKALALYEKD